MFRGNLPFDLTHEELVTFFAGDLRAAQKWFNGRKAFWGSMGSPEGSRAVGKPTKS